MEMKRVRFSSKRLVIRPVGPKDYEAWVDAFARGLPKQNRYDRNPYRIEECTRSEFKKYLKRHRDKARDEQVYIWGVFAKSTGQMVGMLDITILCRRSIHVGNLGYRIFNRHWRKGYAKEFVRAAIPVVLKTLKINRLEASIDLTNRASIRTAKGAGMLREGIRRSYYLQDGKWADQVIFTACRKDWGVPPLKP